MDRFRSMPMSSSAVVTGRGVADIIHATMDLVVMVALALLIGWRPREASPRRCSHSGFCSGYDSP